MPSTTTVTSENNNNSNYTTTTAASVIMSATSPPGGNAAADTTNNDDNDQKKPSATSQNNNNTNKQSKNNARATFFSLDTTGGKLQATWNQMGLPKLVQRKYNLPDKTVASQLLMYRQLLHTKCKPGLKLSRDYQGTAAQKAVLHMPWWEQGIEQSGKMIISYDNLLVRLWLNGAIMPFLAKQKKDDAPASAAAAAAAPAAASAAPPPGEETFLDDEGLPPVPHEYWVDRLGFQQPDPVTDFRSGGVLSLGLLVYIVESCPNLLSRMMQQRHALPFGITCINITDMLAKFLMLAKSVDKMDTLLSQKPFWRMFADPSAILACTELSLTLLCDVVDELELERSQLEEEEEEDEEGKSDDDVPKKKQPKVSVFDFSLILERTEKRVHDDLLGAGPKNVQELHEIGARLRLQYRTQLQRKLQKKKLQQIQHQQQLDQDKKITPHPPSVDKVTDVLAHAAANITVGASHVAAGASQVADRASHVASGVWSKLPVAATRFGRKQQQENDDKTDDPMITEAAVAAADMKPAAAPTKVPPPPPAPAETADAIAHFSIDDEDEDDV